jgi:transglutaminase-like putative cysteine protease
MTTDDEEYLQPSELCDFDRCPEIVNKASKLASGCVSTDGVFRHIFSFVKELPYGLDDWDVAASDTFEKGWGMCSGKTNLLVALLRSVFIPARYRIYRIRPEVSLWKEVIGAEDMAHRMGNAPAEQDHVDCEAWLGDWCLCDPSRDTPFERGLEVLGIPLQREAITDASGKASYLRLDSFDDWARSRQGRRRIKENRHETFARVNNIFGLIRIVGAAGK